MMQIWREGKQDSRGTVAQWAGTQEHVKEIENMRKRNSNRRYLKENSNRVFKLRLYYICY